MKDCPKICAQCPKYKPNDRYSLVCPIRHAEWLKGIETLLSKKRAPGQGVAMAEQLIHYMKNGFMKEA